MSSSPSPAPVPAASRSFALECFGHRAELFAVAMRIARDPDLAGDLVQETLLRAMSAHDRFAAGTNLRAWLFRILTNAFINGYRKQRRHQRLASERALDTRRALYGSSEDHVPDAISERTAGELGDEVRTALASLSRESRDVIERADLRGEKYRDIAIALRVPIGTVMSRLFRARRELEAELADYAAGYGIRRAA